MSDNESEEVREAFAAKAEVEGWKCRRCQNEITYGDKEVFLSSKLCSRCSHKEQRD